LGNNTLNNCNYFPINEHKDFFRKPELSIEYNPLDPNNFAPILEVVNTNGISSGIKRKHLKILVRNIGNATAVKCKGELSVLRTIGNTEQRHPSDIKKLCWDDEETKYMNIGKKGDKEFLHIAFADSNFEQKHLAGGLDIYALASTKESLHPTVPITMAQDAFGIGDFEVELNVIGEDVSTKQRMILHVNRNYELLNVDIIPNPISKWKKVKSKLHF
jgi:hypothetical protein